MSNRASDAVLVAGPVAEEYIQLCRLKMQSEILPERELEGCLRGNDLVLDVAELSHKPLVGALRVDQLAVFEHELGIVLWSKRGRMQSVKTRITKL
jgi:hypothetical protein